MYVCISNLIEMDSKLLHENYSNLILKKRICEGIEPTHFIEQFRGFKDIISCNPEKIDSLYDSLKASEVFGYKTIAIFKIYPHGS